MSELSPKDYSGYVNELIDVRFDLFFNDERAFWGISNPETDYVKIFCINDYVTASFLGISLSGLSITTIYISFVYVLGTTFRGVFFGASSKIIYNEMPYPDRLIELGVVIRMAQYRETMIVEKNMYEVLIRLFRSPEMLTNLTKDYLKKPVLK